MIGENEKAIILEIICHSKNTNNTTFTLPPISNLTETICKELNQISFAVKYELKEEKENLEEVAKDDNNILWSVFDNLNRMNDIQHVEHIYYYSDLPCEYVRFSGNVILREKKEECAKKCLSSILSGLSVVNTFDGIKAGLMGETDSISEYSNEIEENLTNLSQICALSVKFNVNQRPQQGTDNNIWYELLQNVNDHIIRGNGANDSNILKVSVSDKKVTLEYSDNGFSVRDFMAICTSGNSGNIINNEKVREGKKGTGFKSIYNLFQEVIIESGPVKCTLHDGPVKVAINERDNTVTVEQAGEWGNNKKEYYPVPVFEKLEGDNVKSARTKITLRFYQNDPVKYNTFISLVFPNCKDKKYEDAFKASKCFLFLENISKFIFYIDIEGQSQQIEFDRELFMKENFYSYTESFCVDESLLDKNLYWREKKDTPVLDAKKKIDFLFPKNDTEMKNDTEVEEEKCLYCTLPINGNKYKLPFYANIPLLELEDSRNKLSENSNEWNRGILKLALCGEGSCFSKMINNLCQANNVGINLVTAYKYFPYPYLYDDFEGIHWKSSLEKIAFIRTTTDGKNCKAYSLNQWAKSGHIDNQEADVFVFLSDNMYWWFGINKTCDFQCGIPYVYYEDTYVDKSDSPKGSYGSLHEKIIKYYGNAEEELEKKLKEESNVRELLGRSKAGYVGKIPPAISDYLDRKSFSISSISDFNRFLKKILKIEEEFNFANRLYRLYKVFLVANGFDCKKGYQCINNRNLKKDEYIDLNNYESVREPVESIRTKLYDDSHIWQEKEISSIKACFMNADNTGSSLLESPFIEYLYEWNGDVYTEKKALRDEPIVLSGLRVNDEIIVSLTEELLTVNWENDKDKIKKWIGEEKLKGRDSKGNIICLSDSCYYCKDLKLNNIFDTDCYNGWLKNLADEIRKPAFYYINSEELIKAVLSIEPLKVFWKQGLENTLTSVSIKGFDENHKNIIPILLKKLVSEDTVTWIDDFGELIDQFEKSDFVKGRASFEFSADTLFQLPTALVDSFKRKVSSEKQNQKYQGISLSEIVEEKIYIKKSHIGHKRLYCIGNYHNETVIVLFGENAFGTVLRDEFDCNEYSENRPYADMTCNAVSGFFNRGIPSKFLNDTEQNLVKGKVNEIVTTWKKENNKDYIMSQLIGTFEIKADNGWIKAEGYGKTQGNYIEKKCPLCGATLLAEKSILNISYVTFTKKSGDNLHLPVMICNNCYKSIAYAEEITVNLKEDIEELKKQLALHNNQKKDIDVFFNMYGHDRKIIPLETTFLLRWLWYIAIMNEVN